MKRRLIKQRESYTVTLPKKWVDRLKISKQHEIEVTEVTEGLLLSSEKKQLQKEAKLSIAPKNSRFLKRLLISYYRAGYNKIQLSGQIKEKDLLKELEVVPGFEITKKDGSNIILECVSEPDVEQIEKLVRQLFYIARQNLLDLTNSIIKKERINVETLLVSSDRLLRNSNLALRAVNRRMEDTDGFIWTLVSGLVWIDRQTYYLAKELSTMPKTELKKQLSEYLLVVVESIELLQKATYEGKLELFDQIQSNYSKYEHDLYKLVSGQSKATALAVLGYYNISNIILRLGGTCIAISSLSKNAEG